MPSDVTESTDPRDVVITRVFDAPRRLLFEAFSKPEHMQQWYGPTGFSLPLCEMDFRTGGHFRFGMRGPDGTNYPPFGGVYLEVVPDERIVYTSGWDGDETMVVTTTFVEHAGRTTLTIHTRFASLAMRDKHVGMGYVGGVGQGLDRLGRFVA